MVETLRGGAVNDREAAEDFLTRIDHEVDGLTDLVGDLLALSREVRRILDEGGLRATRILVSGDLDERKIEVARGTIEGRESLRFEVGDIVHEAPPKCDAVTIIDVLYLFPPSDQEELIRKAAGALVENAPLVVKAQEQAISPRYALTYAQELVTTALGVTRGGARRFHFLPRDAAVAMFGRAGFLVDVIEMPGRPYTDVVYLARKAPATR